MSIGEPVVEATSIASKCQGELDQQSTHSLALWFPNASNHLRMTIDEAKLESQLVCRMLGVHPKQEMSNLNHQILLSCETVQGTLERGRLVVRSCWTLEEEVAVTKRLKPSLLVHLHRKADTQHPANHLSPAETHLVTEGFALSLSIPRARWL